MSVFVLQDNGSLTFDADTYMYVSGVFYFLENSKFLKTNSTLHSQKVRRFSLFGVFKLLYNAVTPMASYGE